MSENNEKIEKFRLRISELLRTMTTEELSYTLGRYCGPNNQILSEKKFGYSMPKDMVEKELVNRLFEDNFLTTDSE